MTNKKILSLVLAGGIIIGGIATNDTYSLIKNNSVYNAISLGNFSCNNNEYENYANRNVSKLKLSNSNIKMISKTIDFIDENYDDLSNVLGDENFKTKDEFIYDYIDLIAYNVKEIDFYNSNSKIDTALYNKKFEGGYEGVYIHEKNQVNIFNPIESDNEITLISLIHEIIHSNQNYLKENYDYGKWEIFGEGAASFWSRCTTSKYFNDIGSTSIYDNNNDNNYYRLNGPGSLDYSSYAKYYTMFLILCGADACDEYTQTCDENILINAINSKYEGDSEKIVKDIFSINAQIAYDVTNEDFYDKLIYVEDCFLNDYLIQDVEKINSKEDAIKMLNLYRYYKLNCQTNYIRDNKDCTNEKFDIESFEEPLFDKMIEYGVFDDLSCDYTDQRNIYNSLLHSDSFDYNNNYMNSDVPIDLLSSTITYNNGVLQITKDDELCAEYRCNENGIKARTKCCLELEQINGNTICLGNYCDNVKTY